MSMNRRRFLGGITGTTIGLSAMFGSAASVNNDEVKLLISKSYGEIAVHEAVQNSAYGVVLHHGDSFDKNTLKSIKNSISQMGFKVTSHSGGPDGAVASYAFGQNFPAAHYDAANVHILLKELQNLSDLHTQAAYYQTHPDL